MNKQPRRPRGKPVQALTVQQVALLHGVAGSTIRMAIYQGRLPAVQHGSAWLIKKSDAEKWAPAPNAGPRKAKGESDGSPD